jgi:hypothetical protein
MCEGRFQEAALHWEAARARMIQRQLDSGLARFCLEKWAAFEAQCRAAPAGYNEPASTNIDPVRR